MDKRIAFVCSDRMGDSLIGMVAVNNLCRAGCSVTVFSDYLFQLKDCFPGFSIQPYPLSFAEKDDWKDFEKVVVLFDRPFVRELKAHHPVVEVMSDSALFRSAQSMVDIQMEYCRRYWGIAQPVRHNGIVSLSPGGEEVVAGRVAIHPSSADAFKVWPRHKFLQLADLLREQGFTPVFVVAPGEFQHWQAAVDKGHEVVCFDRLVKVAEFLARSQFFIGCDSGLGHLASCLGVPTVSIAIRKGTARMWAPAWHHRQVVLAPGWLFCRPLKTRFWKQAVRPRHVMRAFMHLQKSRSPASLQTPLQSAGENMAA